VEHREKINMATKQAITAVSIAVSMVWSVLSVSAEGDTFKGRLSPVPVENAAVSGITGSGSATAALSDRRLTVRGTFSGMRTPATIAQIHLGPRGIRGPVMFDLTVTRSTSGTISGTFMLTPEQVEAVKSGRFYVQIHSEKAPDGNLWGWLLP
jgi:hypothetical protein